MHRHHPAAETAKNIGAFFAALVWLGICGVVVVAIVMWAGRTLFG
jgi:hypothetical protein